PPPPQALGDGEEHLRVLGTRTLPRRLTNLATRDRRSLDARNARPAHARRTMRAGVKAAALLAIDRSLATRVIQEARRRDPPESPSHFASKDERTSRILLRLLSSGCSASNSSLTRTPTRM